MNNEFFKKDSIHRMKKIIEKCNDSISQYGDNANVFMNPITSYHPFSIGEGQLAPCKAKPLRDKLIIEIKLLEM